MSVANRMYRISVRDAGLIRTQELVVKDLKRRMDTVKGASAHPGSRGAFTHAAVATHFDDQRWRAYLDKALDHAEKFKKTLKHHLFGFSEFTVTRSELVDIVDHLAWMGGELELFHIRIGQKKLPSHVKDTTAVWDLINDFSQEVYAPVSTIQQLVRDILSRRHIQP